MAQNRTRKIGKAVSVGAMALATIAMALPSLAVAQERDRGGGDRAGSSRVERRSGGDFGGRGGQMRQYGQRQSVSQAPSSPAAVANPVPREIKGYGTYNRPDHNRPINRQARPDGIRSSTRDAAAVERWRAQREGQRTREVYRNGAAGSAAVQNWRTQRDAQGREPYGVRNGNPNAATVERWRSQRDNNDGVRGDGVRNGSRSQGWRSGGGDQRGWQDRDRDTRSVNRQRDWRDNSPSWQNDRRAQSWQNDNWRGNGRDNQRWNRGWRSDNRYNWSDYRSRNRNIYRPGRYIAPYASYRYSRIGIGFTLGSLYYGQNYWLSDPYQYRLPEVYGPYRWVRYYDDVVLVDIYTGEVVDVIYDFFW